MQNVLPPVFWVGPEIHLESVGEDMSEQVDSIACIIIDECVFNSVVIPAFGEPLGQGAGYYLKVRGSCIFESG